MFIYQRVTHSSYFQGLRCQYVGEHHLNLFINRGTGERWWSRIFLVHNAKEFRVPSSPVISVGAVSSASAKNLGQLAQWFTPQQSGTTSLLTGHQLGSWNHGGSPVGGHISMISSQLVFFRPFCWVISQVRTNLFPIIHCMRTLSPICVCARVFSSSHFQADVEKHHPCPKRSIVDPFCNVLHRYFGVLHLPSNIIKPYHTTIVKVT